MSLSVHVSEIVRIVSALGDKSTKRLFRAKGKTTQVAQLARRFAEGGKEDSWAVEITGSDSSSKLYRRVRSKLMQQQLLNLFRLDLKDGSELRRVMYVVMRRCFQIRVLSLLGASRTALRLLPHTLDLTRKFELTYDRIGLLLLSRSKAAFQGKHADRNRIDEELQATLKLHSAEMEIASLLEKLNVHISTRSVVTKELLAISKPIRREAELLFDTFSTFQIGLNYYRIATTTYAIEDDHEKVLRVSSAALRFLSGFPHMTSATFLGEFAVKRMIACLTLRRYDEGLEAAALCLQYRPVGSTNWFVVTEYILLLYMQSRRYEEAAALYREVTSHERFQVQFDHVRQKWIYYGYFLAFVEGRLGTKTSVALDRSWREVPIYHSEKSGFNTSIVILQFLQFVTEGDIDSIIVRSEALKQYLMRHLIKANSGPRYAFVKSLVVLADHDLDLHRVEGRLKRYIEQFSRKVISHEESEVLTYEELWKIVTDGAERMYENGTIQQWKERKARERQLAIESSTAIVG